MELATAIPARVLAAQSPSLIVGVELCPFLETFRAPVRGRSERAGWRLWVRDAAGRVGEGEAVCWPGFGAGEEATSESLERCARALTGLRFGTPATSAADSSQTLDPEAWLAAWSLAPEARHALETALLDLAAQREGLRLAELLARSSGGAAPRSRVQSQALVSDAESARAACAAGYRHLKLKASAPLGSDFERWAEVKAATRACAERVELRVDANGRWSPPEAARAAAVALDLDLAWLEQPLPPGDLEGLAALRARGVRVAVDEGVRHAADLEAHLAADALDALVLKPAFLGGPLTTLRLASRAAEAGLEVMVTHALDGEVGRLAALHLAAAAPGLVLTGLAPVLTRDAGPSGPWLALPAQPGLGSSSAAQRESRCEAEASPHPELSSTSAPTQEVP